MAKFDLSKYEQVSGPSAEGRAAYERAGAPSSFDLSKYEQVSGPSSAGERAKQILEEDMNLFMPFAEDVGSGVREPFQNLAAKITSALPEGYQIPRFEAEPHTKYGRIPIEVGRILGSIVPGMGAERAAMALGNVARLPALLGRVGGAAAGGAAAAESLDANPILGSILGGGTGLATEGAMQILGKFLGRNKSLSEAQKAIDAIPEGIKAPIGEIADSPAAKQAYDMSRGIAWSGASKPYSQLYDHLTEGSNLWNNAPGVGNPSEYLYDEVAKAYRGAKETTKKAYGKLAKVADAKKVPFNRDSFDESIREGLAQIEENSINPIQSKYYAGSKDALENYLNTPLNTYGDVLKARKGINNLIKKSSKDIDDPELLSFLNRMKSGLDKSLEESAISEPELYDLHQEANQARIAQGKFEKMNLRDPSPFYKIFRKRGTPDNFISSYLKTGSKGDDATGLLSQLTDKLSPEARGVLAKSHINPKGELSLAQQLTRLGKLSPGQRDLLFGENAAEANRLHEISKLYPKAKGIDFTPLTGFSGSKPLQTLAGGVGVGTYASTHNPSLLALALGLPVGGRALQKFLRSDALKRRYLELLAKPKGIPKTSSAMGGALLRSALLEGTK